MTFENPFQGQLFADGFVGEAIAESKDWHTLDDIALECLRADLRTLFDRLPTDGAPNESQTETDLIRPVLDRLGWTASLWQQRLSARGRTHVPDGLLFADEAAKGRANSLPEADRYRLGLAIVESKRWGRPLDRRSAGDGVEAAPATQMLSYLGRADVMTEGKLRWGILTDGAVWRLYWWGARSVAEQFFEVDLAAVLDLPGRNEGLFALDEEARRHWLRVFALVFRPEAFLPGAADPRSFHLRAVEEGRLYAAEVAKDLSGLVFGEAFPTLARTIAEAAPDAPLEEVREAALVLLYRLMFVLYAEDRGLLPVRDAGYDDYALRDRVREDVGRRKDAGDAFSAVATNYWSAIDDLCRIVDGGDASIGLPAYNGGLFDAGRAPLLTQVRLADAVMADIVDALSFRRAPEGRRYINYRELGVQQLGSIYERLVERELVREEGEIRVRPNPFLRKDWGSYYTPDDLVGLVIEEAVGPLADARRQAFREAVDKGAGPADLARLDPATKILELKVCDPAIGSGHFLVNLVDWLADRTIEAMAASEALAEGYASPLAGRIEEIRETILANAEAEGWAVDAARLDDRHIVRRMVLKRCIYGVDKNPMAVELAKVSLWLHTFTVGAPLSFLDHHLRCGDSLFGAWARTGMDRAADYDAPLLLHGPMQAAIGATEAMRAVEALTDAEIAEVRQSAETFAEVEEKTGPLDAFLSLIHAFDWLNARSKDDKGALRAFFDGQFGDPVAIARGTAEPEGNGEQAERFAELLEQARALVREERFFNWQAAFPGVWTNLESAERRGGFDAVIGNPPWDRMKLQQVEWFAARRPEIAKAPRAADRKRMIAALERAADPLADDYARASERAAAATRTTRKGGDYPLLSGGDINLYSLFVERAMALAKREGLVGLVVPSGIASDKTAARFFKGVAAESRLKALYDFENKKVFFPEVHASFKFCVFVASPSPLPGDAQCAFYLHNVSELDDPERCFALGAADFARVNPNTGTAPIFRSRRDAKLTTAIYGRLPVLVDHSSGKLVNAWPVKYSTMFHMTNDSGLFRTRAELEEKEGAWYKGGNRFDSPSGEWVPLYEGKMVQAFDHRAADIKVNPANVHRPAQTEPATFEQHRDLNWLPNPQFSVLASETGQPGAPFLLGFKHVTAATNVRSMIAALIPAAGAGNSLPLLMSDDSRPLSARLAVTIVANLNALPLDFVLRQKVQGQNLNWFILEQLPVVPPERYESERFGLKTAAEIVREAVLELTYTAHDMAPFARGMGHVDEAGEVLPPFRWDEDRRLRLRAKLDALYFHLYGITGRDDIRYIYSTFPIVEREEEKAWGRYRSRDLCLAWMNALDAGKPDAEIDL